MSNKILLIYAVAANPAPLQISMLNSPTAGTLNISLSNPNKVFCKEIEIAIPFGDGADDLFSEFPALSVNSSLWTLVTSTIEHKVLEVGGGAKQYATFNCSCKDPNAYMIDYPLVFCIQGTVNSVLGDATILLRETASASGDPDSWLIGDYSFVETKNIPQFYVKNFIAVSPDNPTVPCSEFGNGKPVRLSWESNGTFFELYRKNETKPLYSGVQTCFEISGGIKNDTTFILAASMQGSAIQGTPENGFMPIYLYETLTLTVSNPLLTPSSVQSSGDVAVGGLLAVSGAAVLTGNTTVNGALNASGVTSLANASISGLTVSGQTTVGNIRVGGALEANGNISLGNTRLGNTAVNGNLNASGSVSLGATNVNGAFSARSGPVSILGSGSCIASGTTIAQTQMYARTDGFAVIQINGPGDNSKSSFAYGGIYSNAWFTVLGGTVGSFGESWSDVMNNNNNSMCIPIPANTYWCFYGCNPEGSQMDSPISVYWFPMGAAASGESTLEIITGADVTMVPTPFFPSLSEIKEKRKSRANEFLRILENSFNASISASAKEDMVNLLLLM